MKREGAKQQRTENKEERTKDKRGAPGYECRRYGLSQSADLAEVTATCPIRFYDVPATKNAVAAEYLPQDSGNRCLAGSGISQKNEMEGLAADRQAGFQSLALNREKCVEALDRLIAQA